MIKNAKAAFLLAELAYRKEPIILFTYQVFEYYFIQQDSYFVAYSGLSHDQNE